MVSATRAQELGARLARGHAWLATRQLTLNLRPNVGIGTVEEEEYLRQIDRWCEMELEWRQAGGVGCPVDGEIPGCPRESPVSCRWCEADLEADMPSQGKLV